jgi:hypothetical protein
VANKRMKKMINIRSHQENANQNYTESLNHACQNGNHQENEQQMLARRGEKVTLTPLVGM